MKRVIGTILEMLIIIIGIATGMPITTQKVLAYNSTQTSFITPVPEAPPIIKNITTRALNIIWYVALAAIIGMIIWSGITMLTSEDPRDQAAARSRLIRVIIGAVIILGGLEIIKWLITGSA
jgi:hypothetical protein